MKTRLRAGSLIVFASILFLGLFSNENKNFAAAGKGEGLPRITIQKEAFPADGTDFLFQTNALLPSTFLFQWGKEGNGAGEFASPKGITRDSSGNMYVVDATNQRVQVFGPDGQFLRMWGWGVDTGANTFEICTSGTLPCHAGISGNGNGQFLFPYGVAVDSFGNVYVADSSNHRIQKFDPNGNFITSWGSFGTGIGQFNTPFDLAVDDTDRIFVADNGNERVQIFDVDGVFLSSWGTGGGNGGEFASLLGIDFDPLGNVVIVDSALYRVQVLDSDGNFIRLWGWGVDTGASEFEVCTVASLPCQIGIPGDGNGQFDDPRGVSVDTFGNVYITDVDNNNVQIFNSAGNFLATFGSLGGGQGEFINPDGILVDPTGLLSVTDGINRIQVFGGTFSLDDANPDDGDDVFNSHSLEALVPGTYVFREFISDSWELTSLSCASGNWNADPDKFLLTVFLESTDDISCTFANTAKAIFLPIIIR